MSIKLNQAKDNNLNYQTDVTSKIVNRLFVFSFESEADRTPYVKYYIPTVKRL